MNFALTYSNLFFYGSFSLIAIGLYILFTGRNLIKMLVGLNIAETGVNLLIVFSGAVRNGTAPIISGTVSSTSDMADPVPQALVLTSIVIGFGVTAFALALAVKLYEKYNTLDVNKIRGLRW